MEHPGKITFEPESETINDTDGPKKVLTDKGETQLRHFNLYIKETSLRNLGGTAIWKSLN